MILLPWKLQLFKVISPKPIFLSLLASENGFCKLIDVAMVTNMQKTLSGIPYAI